MGNQRPGESGSAANLSRERTLQRNKKLSGPNAERKDFGYIDEAMPKMMNTKNPAAPYTVNSSTINHVTRQNSAIQSVVTDQSSTFSAQSDPLRIQRQQYRAEKRPMKANAYENDQKGRGGGNQRIHGPLQPAINKIQEPESY